MKNGVFWDIRRLEWSSLCRWYLLDGRPSGLGALLKAVEKRNVS
jgi:hypothetical protein